MYRNGWWRNYLLSDTGTGTLSQYYYNNCDIPSFSNSSISIVDWLSRISSTFPLNAKPNEATVAPASRFYLKWPVFFEQ